jgi:F-type H+-transporting ATPase subunit epsilon
MATTFQLRIVTPRQVLLDAEVREVTASGSVGEFGVLPEHTTFLSSLEPGALTYSTDSGVRRLAIRGGFAEVVDDVMTVLADDAVFAEDVDAERARNDLAEAEKKLDGMSSYDAEFVDADTERRWALARLDAANAPR